MQRTLIIGGSSGMGLGLAHELLEHDDTHVTIVGRSPQRLAAAERELDGGERLHARRADATNESEVEQLLGDVGDIDHLVTTAADVARAYQPAVSMDIDAAQSLIDSKLISAILLAKHGSSRIRPGGSITFTSGIAAYRPGPNGSVAAAVNAALAGLTRALALELAPIRVNAISPGWIETPIWDTLAGDQKRPTLDGMAQRLPVGRVGAPRDVALAIAALMENGFITGEVLHADGGHRLV